MSDAERRMPVRASITPAAVAYARPIAVAPAAARISAAALSPVPPMVRRAAPRSLPLLASRSGSVFRDRFDPALRWFLPSYAVAADPDASFAFAATRDGVAGDGTPFHKGRVTLGLRKTVPDDVLSLRAAEPQLDLREIPLANVTAVLRTTYRDAATGEERHGSYAGHIAALEGGSLEVTFDNVLGPSVMVLYENLASDGGAVIVLSGTYEGWRQDVPGSRAAPLRVRLPASPVMRPAVPTSRLPLRRVVPETWPIDDARLELESMQATTEIAIAGKYAAGIYATRFTVTDGATTRPIIDIEDLKSFNLKQSEFVELTALGDINARYPSIAKAYLGVLSRTVMVIPARYAIARTRTGLNAVCQALLDSASVNVTRCTFQFTFLLAPDVSAIDLLQLAQEIGARPELRGCTVKLPEFLHDDRSPHLTTAFQSTCTLSDTDTPHVFELMVAIHDAGDASPAVASANLLIKQLSSDPPTAFATVRLKLDDNFPQLVEATAVLNFRRTSGSPDELGFVVDEPSSAIVLENRSPFDMRLVRYALCTPAGVTISAADVIVKAADHATIALPAAHEGLTLLADRIPVIAGIPKSETDRYLSFQTEDVQNTAVPLGVNVADVKFETRGISRIDVVVTPRDAAAVTVQRLTLSNGHRVDNAIALVPIPLAMTSLLADVTLTARFAAPGIPEVTATLEHDFAAEPVLIVFDATLPAPLGT